MQGMVGACSDMSTGTSSAFAECVKCSIWPENCSSLQGLPTMTQTATSKKWVHHTQQHNTCCQRAGDFNKRSHLPSSGSKTRLGEHSTQRCATTGCQQAWLQGGQAVLAGVVCMPGRAVAGAEAAARPVPWPMCESQLWEQYHGEQIYKGASRCKLGLRRGEKQAHLVQLS
jgi:hypothetical protein